MKDETVSKAVVGIGCTAWLIYVVLFVAFWAVVAWAIINLVQANT